MIDKIKDPIGLIMLGIIALGIGVWGLLPILKLIPLEYFIIII